MSGLLCLDKAKALAAVKSKTPNQSVKNNGRNVTDKTPQEVISMPQWANVT